MGGLSLNHNRDLCQNKCFNMKIIPIQKRAKDPKKEFNHSSRNFSLNLTRHYENTLEEINNLIVDHFRKLPETKKIKEMKAVPTINTPLSQTNKDAVLKASQLKRIQPVGRRLCIPDQNGLQILLFEEILFFRSNGNYTEVNLIDGQYHIFAKTLKTFEGILPDQFFRVHNQYIVNKIYISRIEHSGVVKLRSNHKIPLARGRRQSFHDWMMDASLVCL